MQTAKTTSTGRPLLVDQVLGWLTSYIRSEGLSPGDRLPSEAELVNRMQCSRIRSTGRHPSDRRGTSGTGIDGDRNRRS